MDTESLVSPNLNARDFIVASDYWPTGWTPQPCESQLCENSDGATYEQFFHPVAYKPGQFFEVVYRFHSTKEASDRFSAYRKGEYNKDSFDVDATSFAQPAELQYISPIADQYLFACAQQFGLVCKMSARYQNYFIFMYFDMDTGEGFGLTYEEVEGLLLGLDKQVQQLLDQ